MTNLPRDQIRPPAIAGSFYLADPAALTGMIDRCLGAARDHGLAPKALIAPHAGLVYSGPIAGNAYRNIADQADRITRVVLLGPPHRVAVSKFCVPAVSAFRTPLGDVRLDPDGITTALTIPGVGPRPYETQPPLALIELAEARTQIALDAPVLQREPVAAGHAVKFFNHIV